MDEAFAHVFAHFQFPTEEGEDGVKPEVRALLALPSQPRC